MRRLGKSVEFDNLPVQNPGKLPGNSGKFSGDGTPNHTEITGSLEDALPVIRERLGGGPKRLHETDGEPITFDTRKKGKRSGWVYVVHKPDGWLLTCGDARGGAQHTIFVRDALAAGVAPDLPASSRQKDNGAAERAAQKANALCELARPAGDDHPYLVRKGVKPTDTLRELCVGRIREIIGYHPYAGDKPLEGRILIAPVVIGDKISTVEFIDERGNKSALKDGRKSGGYWATGALPETGRLVLAEGVATALSIAAALGEPVVAALSVHNVEKVGRALQGSGREMAIAADLGEGGKPHRDAIEAARKLGARLCAPPSGMGKGADFNDLCARDGLDAVRAAFERPIAVEPAGQDAGSILSQPVRPGLDERPCFWLLEEPAVIGGRQYRSGVYRCDIKQEKQFGEVVPVPTETWLSSPIRVEARTTEWPDGAQGLRLDVHDGNGWRDVVLPREALASRRHREILLSCGASLEARSRDAMAWLTEYLQQSPPRREYTTERTGWHGEQYVLPDATAGTGATILFAGARATDEPLTAGELSDWRESVAALAAGNPLLAFAISLAFVGPVLKLVGYNTVMAQLVGPSTTGKTTCLMVANSVVGPPMLIATWYTTASGLEQQALLRCDGLLALDEVAQVDAKTLANVVYALEGGTAKQRATVYEHGVGAAPTQRWRVAVFSTGEKTMETLLSTDGRNVNAGQAVRFIEIPAEERHGAFAKLHGYGSGAAFADALRRAANRYYGTPIRAFVGNLCNDDRDALDQELDRHTARLREAVNNSGAEPGAQASRVLTSLALVAMAGEMATRYGVTGWNQGEAFGAALHCYRLWAKSRPTQADFEQVDILRRMRDFLDKYGDSKFSECTRDVIVHDRAGYYRDTDDGREYLFTSDGFQDAVRGFDFKLARKTLADLNVLKTSGGRDTVITRLKRGYKRLFCVADKALDEALEKLEG